MTRELSTLAAVLLGASSAPAVVRARHPWSPDGRGVWMWAPIAVVLAAIPWMRQADGRP